MADRSFIPSSPACGQWETLLADALDGLLRPEDEQIFAAHMAVCPACTALFDEARRGREWLEFLAPEPEVPLGLLDKILARTGPGQVEGYGLITGGAGVLPMPPAWQRPGFVGNVRRFAEPRLLMTAAMAFFSLTLTLYLTGFRLSNVHLADLKPTAVRSFMERRLTMASTPIVRYYDHLRFVYEVESRMRQLRRSAPGQDDDSGQAPKSNSPAAPGESKQAPGHKDGGSRMDPPQQSVNPARNDNFDFLETSLEFNSLTSHARPAHSAGSAMAARERSTKWTA
jgi:hypothetical protein